MEIWHGKFTQRMHMQHIHNRIPIHSKQLGIDCISDIKTNATWELIIKRINNNHIKFANMNLYCTDDPSRNGTSRTVNAPNKYDNESRNLIDNNLKYSAENIMFSRHNFSHHTICNVMMQSGWINRTMSFSSCNGAQKQQVHILK